MNLKSLRQISFVLSCALALAGTGCEKERNRVGFSPPAADPQTIAANSSGQSQQYPVARVPSVGDFSAGRRMVVNESSTVASLRTLNTAEYTYQVTNSGFACSLSILGGSNLVDGMLASGAKSGYVFDLHCLSRDGKPDYEVWASPQSYGRYFCSDSSAVIRVSDRKLPDCRQAMALS